MLHIVPPAVMDDPPWLDTAVSWALLQRTATGAAPETLRLVRPARTLAFGPADRLLPGYEAARAAARALGFAPVTRLAGGHAAVFHEDTLAFSWTLPDPRARTGIRDRFEVIAGVIAEALRDLGVDARIGAVPGEYCAGDYSVSAAGRTKLMGVGQRVLARAAYVGGVIVVDRGDLVRDALDPVYRSLGIEWDPATSGSVRAEAPGVTWDDVASALLAAFARRYEVRDTSLDSELVEEARAFAVEFGDVPAG